MPFETCIVNLNSDSTGSFYTGDIVTGNIILELNQERQIEQIDLEVIGISKAQWTRPSPTMPYIKIYSEKEKVLSIKFPDIFQGISNGKKISPGVYSYPFHFALPEDLPSTFKSSVAQVSYIIKITSKPAGRVKKVVPFVVYQNVNLNHIDDMLMPVYLELEKQFKNSEKMIISLKTYKSFAPKQNIPFEVTISNNYKGRISAIKVSLIQKLHYKIKSGYMDEEKKICKVAFQDVYNTVAEVCFFNMDISQVVPSTFQTQEALINVSYVFRVEIVFWFHFSITGELPVTIATLPVIHYDF